MKTFSGTMRAGALYGVAALMLCLASPIAHAQDMSRDSALPQPEPLASAPAMTNTSGAMDVDLPEIDATDPILRLSPDKSEILNLSRDVRSVVVGNENHIQVFLDSARRLVVVPRIPGATFFTALGANGEIVMQRHVIVAGPKDKYIRIRRNCGAGSSGCVPMQTFYCPDMCHEIKLATQGGGSATVPSTAMPNAGTSTQSGDNNPDSQAGAVPVPPIINTPQPMPIMDENGEPITNGQ
jgi:hypothetical protein